jgi:Tol biopolymer transport system component
MKEPDLDELPAQIRRVLKRCLEKDPRKRLRDISGVELLLDEAPETAVAVATPAPSRGALWARLGNAVFAAAVVFALAFAALAFVHFREKPPAAEPVRFQIGPPEKVTLFPGPPVVSPDGRRLAFIASEGTDTRLWVRSLDTLEARPLAGTDGVNQNTFFWSPDSRFLGFVQADKLRKIDVSGGPPQTVCDVRSYRGGGWGPGGVIAFGVAGSGLLRVSEAGGQAYPLTKLDTSRGEIFHTTPSFLPDARHFLYFRQGTPEIRGIYIGSMDLKPEQQSEKRLLAADGIGVYAPSADRRTGYLLFLRDRSLMAQPFDAGRMELSGDAFPIAEAVGNNFQNSWFSASATGVLAYRTGTGAIGGAGQLIWFDRSGKNLGAAGEPGVYQAVTLSPDGTRAAVMKLESSTYAISLHEFARAITTRLTFDPADDRLPVWSPDGKRIAFTSLRGGLANLYQKPSNGAGNEEILFQSNDNKQLQDWSQDGRFLIYSQPRSGGDPDLWVLPVEGDKRPVAYVKSATEGRFSPDTRFVAYSSNVSGKNEIYVQTFPDAAGGKWMVSKGGGGHPRWRRDGRELFYVSPELQMMAVDVGPSPTFHADIPKALFRAPIRGGQGDSGVTRYDVAANGQRFLINAVGIEANPEEKASPITVVLNWQAGLKK